MPFGAIAGIVGGLGSIAGAAIGGNAAQSAANTQAQAAQYSTQLQRDEFNQTTQNLKPFLQGGTNAFQNLLQLLGVGSPGTPGTAATPGYWTGGAGAGGAAGGAGGAGAAGGAAQPGTGVGYNPGTGNFSSTGVMVRNPYSYTQGGEQSGSGKQWAGAGPTTTQGGPVLGIGGQGGSGGGAGTYVPGTPGTAGTPGTPFNTNAFLTAPFDTQTFQSSPGYQFQFDQGQNAVENAASRQGGPFSGNALKALTTFGQGVANQDYWNQYNAYVGRQKTLFDELSSVAGSGQNAAVAQGGFGQNFGAAAGANAIGAGNATAAGQVGAGNALSSALTGLTSANGPLSGLFNGGQYGRYGFNQPVGSYTAGGWQITS